ncbi:MAG: hypothetical protein ACXWCM_00555 [Acidimicrobiales bacterium]
MHPREGHRWPLAVLLGAFVLSRLAAWIAGVRFDATPLRTYWQFADPRLLEDDLGRTLWWFHAQPPAFNALAGGVLQLPEGWRLAAFTAIFLGLGVSLLLAMYALALLLGVPRWVAVAVVLVFCCSPAALVYENLLFYPYLIAALVTATFAGMALYLRSGAAAWGLLTFALAATLVATRAAYHLVWLLALVVAVLIAAPRFRRRTLLVAIVPVLLATGLYAKNAVQFGSFTASSWVGLNLADVVRRAAPPGTRLPGLLATAPFSRPDAFQRFERPPTGVPVLDDRYNSLGRPNYNNILYVDVSNEYLHESVDYIRSHPGQYAGGVRNSFAYYFSPPTAQPTAFGSNEPRLGGYTRVYDAAIGWQATEYRYYEPGSGRRYVPSPGDIQWSMVLVYVLALSVLPVVLWRARFRPRRHTETRWVLAMASATIWMAMMTGNLFETTENSRFRFETDPIAWVLAAAVVAGLSLRWAGRRRAGLASTPGTGCGPSRWVPRPRRPRPGGAGT